MENKVGTSNNNSSSSSANSSILRNCITKVSNLFRSKSSVGSGGSLPLVLETTKTEPIISDTKDDDVVDGDVTLRNHNLQPQTKELNKKNSDNSDIDKSLVAESEDVVTPLPVCNSKPFAFGNGIRPEIVEIIKNMDSKSLRLNNLTVEDRMELLKRYGKEEKSKANNGFRNSSSCPSFSATSAGLYERRIRENEQRLRLNFIKSEVFIELFVGKL